MPEPEPSPATAFAEHCRRGELAYQVAPDGTVVVAGAPGEVVHLVGWNAGAVVEREVVVPDRGWERLRPF